MGEHHAEANCRLLQLLLTDDVRNVSLTWLPRVHNRSAMNRVTDLWYAMTQKCPRLQKIVCQNFYTSRSNGLLMFFSFSLSFVHMQVLDMTDMTCTDLRLGLIAQHLPQLR